MKNRNLPASLNQNRDNCCFPLLHVLEDLLKIGNRDHTIRLTDDGETLILTADIPGFDPRVLDITVEEKLIILKGDTRQAEIRDQPGCYFAAQSYLSFYRTIPLPAGVKPEATVARYNNGVLELKMIKGHSLVRSFKPLAVSEKRIN